VPGRRSLFTTALLLGSSSWGVLRWLTGYWLPSPAALLSNKLLMGFMTGFGLLGAALTYLYGGTDNPKARCASMKGGMPLTLISVPSVQPLCPAEGKAAASSQRVNERGLTQCA
jgi:hypothetical protein